MQIGQYTKIREMGEGGMGTVTLGTAPDGGLVVIKRPHPNQPDLEKRIVDEANLGFMLRHPHLVETLDLFYAENRPNLVVRFIPGTNLTQIRQRKAQVPLGLIARIGRQISEALAAIHNASSRDGRLLNAVHRDVTPGNILIDQQGNAQLIDLGIARSRAAKADRTQEGFIRGTLRYLPPEAFGDGGCGPQGDLWSLGLVLHEAALAKRTFDGRDVEVVGRIIAFPGLVDDEGLDPRLYAILNLLLKTDIKERVQNAEQAVHLFSQLERAATDDDAVAAFLQKQVPSSAFDFISHTLKNSAQNAITVQPSAPKAVDPLVTPTYSPTLNATSDAPHADFQQNPWILPSEAGVLEESLGSSFGDVLLGPQSELSTLAAQELAALEAWSDETWSRP